MGDQKNLILAIVISVAIIIVFQILFPQQTMIVPDENIDISESPTTITSIDQVQTSAIEKIKTREEIISDEKRIKISSQSLEGSINLKGAIIDDLILKKYKVSLDENSNNIQLLSPNGTKNPYYLEMGWKELTNNVNNIELPNNEEPP